MHISYAQKVYPRVCGGATGKTGTTETRIGLSPRVRGSLKSQSLLVPDEGSIPACAGEPVITATAAAKTAVYPRVCGGAAIAN